MCECWCGSGIGMERVKVEWRYHVIVKIYEGPVGCEGCKERTAAAAARWTEFERIEGNCTARGETAV